MTEDQIKAKIEDIKSMDNAQLIHLTKVISISHIEGIAKHRLYQAIDDRRVELDKIEDTLAVNGYIDDIIGG